MTDRKANLIALREAIVSEKWQGKIGPMCDAIALDGIEIMRAVVGDMNSAIDFVASALPGWTWRIGTLTTSGFIAWIYQAGRWRIGSSRAAPTPALALTLAALDALIAKEDE